MIILSWLLIIAGFSLPLLALKYIKNEFVFMMYVFILIFCYFFTYIGILKNPWLASNEIIWRNIFITLLIELTLLAIYYIFLTCRHGLRLVFTENPWDKHSKKSAILIRLFLIPFYMLLPSLVLSPLYSLWALIITHDYQFTIGNALYFGLTLAHSIPQSGVFEQFQHQVNSHLILQILATLHTLGTRIIELIVIGIVINQASNLLFSNKSKHRTKFFSQLQKRRNNSQRQRVTRIRKH